MVTRQRDLLVLDDPTSAAALLSPMRREILALLTEPGSATTVGRSLGIPRQKANYHVRALEDLGLLEEVGTRQRHGCTERLLRSRARRYVVDPTALGPLGADPDHIHDRFSSAYLIASASRTIRDVATLRRGADAAGKKIATFTLEAEVAFPGPREQAAFLEDLADALADVVRKHHAPAHDSARTYRVAIGGHPLVPSTKA